MKNEEWLDREISSFVGAMLHVVGKQGPGIDPGIAPLSIPAGNPPDEQVEAAAPLQARHQARRKKPIQRAKR